MCRGKRFGVGRQGDLYAFGFGGLWLWVAGWGRDLSRRLCAWASRRAAPLAGWLRLAANRYLLPTTEDHVLAFAPRSILLLASAPPASVAVWHKRLLALFPGARLSVCPTVTTGPAREAFEAIGVWRALTRRHDLLVAPFVGGGARALKLVWAVAPGRHRLAIGLKGEFYLWNPPRLRAGDVNLARVLARCLVALLASVVVALVGALLFLWDLLCRVVARAAPAAVPPAVEGPILHPAALVVVPCHGGLDLLRRSLPPLLQEVEGAAGQHQVVVVDDGSPQPLAPALAREFPAVQVIRLERNVGFGGAVEAALQQCEKPVIVLLNSDMVVSPGFLTPLLRHFADPRVFGVCANITMASGAKLETGVTRGTFTGLLHLDHDDAAGVQPIIFAGGGSSAYSVAKWRYLGGLDPLFRPFYWEDVDLGFRAWRQGWVSLHEPESHVCHQHRATIGRKYSQAQIDRIVWRNQMLYVWKNVFSWHLLAQHFAYLWERVCREIMEGRPAYLGALCAAAQRLPEAMWARLKMRQRGGLSEAEILLRAQGDYQPLSPPAAFPPQ